MTAAQRNPEAKPSVGDYRLLHHSAAEEQQRHRGNVAAYFEERQQRLDVVATTETPRGQVLDWIPVDSQQSGEIAAPPPAIAQTSGMRHPERPTRAARFELDEDTAERGPAGTVPVLRKDLAATDIVRPLRQYLSRRRGRGHRSTRSGDGLTLSPGLDAGGVHRYAETAQSAFNLGGDGFLSVNDPYTETSADFSLVEMAVLNDEQGYVQSAEAGIQEMQSLYGDWGPHLFVYYTTNGYAFEGDNQGGYNRDVDGWVQVDSSVYPGAGFATVSTPGETSTTCS